MAAVQLAGRSITHSLTGEGYTRVVQSLEEGPEMVMVDHHSRVLAGVVCASMAEVLWGWGQGLAAAGSGMGWEGMGQGKFPVDRLQGGVQFH